MEGKRKLLAFIIGLLALIALAEIASLDGGAIGSCFWALSIMFGGGNAAEHYSKRNQQGVLQ